MGEQNYSKMSTKETVVITQVLEKLKKLNQHAENLHSDKGLSVKKINKMLVANNELQEILAIYKYLKPQFDQLDENIVSKENTKEEESFESPMKVVKSDEPQITPKKAEEPKGEKEEVNEEQTQEAISAESETKIEERVEEKAEVIVEEEPELIEDNFAPTEEEINEVHVPEDLPSAIEVESGIEEEKLENEELISDPVAESSEETVLDVESEMNAMGIENSGMEVNEVAALQGEDNTLNTRLQKQPIHDLRRAIGLNERFLYTNELFNGNMEAFNLAINELNHISSLEDAFRIIDLQLKPKYNWEDTSEAVAQFLDLVERRFL